MNTLLPFQFANLPIRGRFIRLKGLNTHVHTLKNSNANIAVNLTEMLALAALMVHDAGHELAVSLQVQHAVTGSLMFASCNEKSELKAYANPNAQGSTFANLARGGQFAVTLEAPDLSQRYQSLVELSPSGVATSLQSYYTHSAQTPTLLHTATGQAGGSLCAAALMLQVLPHEGVQITETDDWQRLQLLLATLTEAEMLTDEPQTLLAKVFAEDDLTLYPAQSTTFSAANPRPRMLAALASLPKAELTELIAKGTVALTDETSGQHITFTAAELAHLLDEDTGPAN